VFVSEIGSPNFALAGLKLSNPLASALKVAGITGVNHNAWQQTHLPSLLDMNLRGTMRLEFLQSSFDHEEIHYLSEDEVNSKDVWEMEKEKSVQLLESPN
jgi:hypothetical protein